MSLSVTPRSCLCTKPRETIRMNPESDPTSSLLSHTPLLPPRGISHIDIGPFLSQGLPQATIAVQFDCRTRLAGLFFPPVSDAHRGNEAPGKMRGYLAHGCWAFGRKPGMCPEGHLTRTHGRALHHDTSGRTSWASEDRDPIGRPFPGSGTHSLPFLFDPAAYRLYWVNIGICLADL